MSATIGPQFTEFKQLTYDDIPKKYRDEIKVYVKESIHDAAKAKYKSYLPEIFTNVLAILETWRWRLGESLRDNERTNIHRIFTTLCDQSFAFELLQNKIKEDGVPDHGSIALDLRIRTILFNAFSKITNVIIQQSSTDCIGSLMTNSLCDLLPKAPKGGFTVITHPDCPLSIAIRGKSVPSFTVSDSEGEVDGLCPDSAAASTSGEDVHTVACLS